jgi:hypothetical protein
MPGQTKHVQCQGLTPLPSTHDLDELIEGLRKKGLDVPPEIAEAVILNSYSAEARYPSLSEPVTTEEHHEAVRLAEAVVTWAEKNLKVITIAIRNRRSFRRGASIRPSIGFVGIQPYVS